MAKVNINQILRNIDGTPRYEYRSVPLPAGNGGFIIQEVKTEKIVNLKDIINDVLFRNDTGITDVVQKSAMFRISVKMELKDEIELSSEEATIVKTLVAKYHNSLVYGQIEEMVEGKPNSIIPKDDPEEKKDNKKEEDIKKLQVVKDDEDDEDADEDQDDEDNTKTKGKKSKTSKKKKRVE